MGQNKKEKFERYFLAVIQGELNTRGAAFWRFALKYFSCLYAAAIAVRQWLYEKRIIRHHTLGCQVISVGNLTVGGTGKTPIVEIFARELQKSGRKVAILSRGYKKVEHRLWKKLLDKFTGRERRRPPRVVSNGKELLLDSAMSGDEPFLLASNLPEAVVIVDKDRVKSGRWAVEKFKCDTLLLDDGFQYRKLKHRIEIVLVDSTNPFSNGHMLPRGLLREPVKNIKRADFVFITKARAGEAELKEQLARLNPRAEISVCRHKAMYFQNVYSDERRELDFIRDRRVAVISGIARPEGFEEQIAALGAFVAFRRRFADHHRYSQQEVIDIINESRKQYVNFIITTEKDAVRFPRLERHDVKIFFLRVEIDLISGEEDFHSLISRIAFR